MTLLSGRPLECGCGSKLVLRLAAIELAGRPASLRPGLAGLLWPGGGGCRDARRDARFGVEACVWSGRGRAKGDERVC